MTLNWCPSRLCNPGVKAQHNKCVIVVVASGFRNPYGICVNKACMQGYNACWSLERVQRDSSSTRGAWG